MNKKDDGGGAFPSPGVVLNFDRNEHQQGAYEGMSLRDYFAIHANESAISSLGLDHYIEWNNARLEQCEGEEVADYVGPSDASLRYQYADAMLAARGESK